VHDAIAGDERLIVDVHVPRQHRATGDENAIAQLAIVRDVRTGEHVIVITDGRRLLERGGAMQLRMFANDVAVADREAGRRVGVAEILRRVTDHGTHVNDVVAADRGASGEHGMGQHARAGAHHYRSIDDHVRTDLGGRFDRRAAVDDGGRVNGHRDAAAASGRINSPCRRRCRRRHGADRRRRDSVPPPNRRDRRCGSAPSRTVGVGCLPRQPLCGKSDSDAIPRRRRR
jgi:hypothetical protein